MAYDSGINNSLIFDAHDLLGKLRMYNQGDTRCRDYSVCITLLEDVRNRLWVYKLEEEGDPVDCA